jgi:diguanylate cyclase (GGDEF)-like protein
MEGVGGTWMDSTTATRKGAGRLARENVERIWGILRSTPRSRAYPALGAVLALGTPAGLLLTTALAAGRVPTFAWALEEIARLPVPYAYLTLSTVAALAVLGYRFGRLFDRLLLLSNTDPLTRLLNRRRFGERVTEEMSRSRRYGHALSVLCVDIDRLKAINDGFGHKAGDRALVAVCRILLKNRRAIDAVARVGGDEFAVLLPETSAAETWALSERILTDVARYRDAFTGQLAVSIGISQLSATTGAESGAMLAAADAALYGAKATGGGHAVIAPAGGGASPGRPFVRSGYRSRDQSPSPHLASLGHPEVRTDLRTAISARRLSLGWDEPFAGRFEVGDTDPWRHGYQEGT